MSAEAPLFSEQWYRVAALRPRLSERLRLTRHRVRGEPWWVLASEDGQRSHRLDALAWGLVGRCNGRHTVEEIWEALNRQFGDAAATQDDVIQLLGRLHTEGWLGFDTAPDLPGLVAERRRRHARRRPFNPLALRIPLGDPQRLVARLDPLIRRLAGRHALIAWFALLLAAAVGGLAHLEELLAHGAKWLATPRYMTLLWCAYPVIKLVHELAHALTVRRFGGDVRQAGITLLVFTPVPYVDASAANLFPSARERALVSLAGVMAELTIASVAVFCWIVLAPGLARDLAFVALVIGCVSTLAVNANPLLRFDGYFAACDLLGLPNLGPRSRSYWAELLRERLLGLPVTAPLRLAPGERPWLLAYAPLSFIYQLLLALLITRWIGALAPGAGLAVGLAFLVLLLGRPALGAWRLLNGPAVPAAARTATLARAGFTAAGAAALLTLVPLPDRTVAAGVVWLPERALVRAGEDGFIEEVLVPDGAQVAPGQLLARMANSATRAEEQRLAARLSGLEARQYAAMRDDPAAAGQLRDAIEQASLELERASAKLEALELHAGAAGRLVMPRQRDIAGGFVHRGEILAYVVTDEPALVRVAVPEARAVLLRDSAPRVEVRLAEAPAAVHIARLVRDSLAAVERLPSAALSDTNGGPFVTDPADRDHRATLAPVVTMDVLLADTRATWLGERAWVRFEHGYRPLLFRWARNLQQAFLQGAPARTR